MACKCDEAPTFALGRICRVCSALMLRKGLEDSKRCDETWTTDFVRLYPPRSTAYLHFDIQSVLYL